MPNLPALADANLHERAAEFARSARAVNTVRGYRSDWTDFERWCGAHELSPLPAEPLTIGLYLTDRSKNLKVATLSRRLVTLTQAHRVAGYTLDTKHPAVRDVFAGIRREIGTKQNPKAALLTPGLRAALKALPQGLAGVRDRAVLLVGFGGALRRSELVALDADDLIFSDEGVALRLRQSKTDQERRGATVGIPKGKRDCPVEALAIWLRIARIKDGAVFRSISRHGAIGDRLSPAAVAEIVKRAVMRVGLDPASFGGHSLRRGFCTQASMNDAKLIDIAKHARHKSLQTTAGYVCDAQVFSNQAAKAAGL